jgi:hypothetical protein
MKSHFSADFDHSELSLSQSGLRGGGEFYSPSLTASANREQA